MATWKEIGEVPDSEDEGDDSSLDGQSTMVYEEKEGNKETRNNEDSEIRHDHNAEDTLQYIISGRENPDEDNLETTTQQSTPPIYSHPVNDPRSHLGGHFTSPVRPEKVFKTPVSPFWEIEEDDEDFEAALPSCPPVRPFTSEEVSKSYVEITSPNSSLTPFPDSQPSSPSNNPRHLLGANRPVEEEAILEVIGESTSNGGRSLRQRNPNQIHPYSLDYEKYKRFMKARGMAPTRIEQSQDEIESRSRDSISLDLDSQEQDSQDLGLHEAESQGLMDFEWDEIPSSSPQKQVDHDGLVIDNDDDFPDIDELLREQTRSRFHSESKTERTKRKLKTYSSKQARSVPSKADAGSIHEATHNLPTRGAFQFPEFLASPPTTSSPITSTAKNNRCSLSRPASSSSKEPSLSQSPSNGITAPSLTNLPTPSTSAAKPASEILLLEHGLDDPFATDAEESSSISSSDESLQIRKVTKKFKGVLPASHVRLEQQSKQLKRNAVHKDSLGLSPVKLQSRRGVALPRIHGGTGNSPAPTSATTFLADDSEDENEENQDGGFFVEEGIRIDTDDFLSQSGIGFAEEEDRVDAMLPPRKRPASSSIRHRKSKRIGSNPYMTTRQPKITDHLDKHQKSAPSHRKGSGNPSRSRTSHNRVNGNRPLGPRSLTTPKLSILDVMHTSSGVLPQFIRIAARTARSRKGQGRQSPFKKIFRLASRDDTKDVLSVLESWKAGRLKPLHSEFQHNSEILRGPLQQIPDNRQSTLRSPEPKVKRSYQNLRYGSAGMPRKLVISNRKQRHMTDFISKEQAHPQLLIGNSSERSDARLLLAQDRHHYIAPSARPAQLESSEVEYTRQHPATAFRTTKKALDALYRTARKRPAPQANIQLSRFLADEDDIRPSVESRPFIDDVGSLDENNNSVQQVQEVNRMRKRMPRRIDAGAAVYRQPSDPLILESIIQTQAPIIDKDGSKLLGLAKFGIKYPRSFDILPLPAGVFFHESTLIGSGRLAEVSTSSMLIDYTLEHPSISLKVVDREFRWSTWGESVSSEIGVCFDAIFDSFGMQLSAVSSVPAIDACAVAMFIYQYVVRHLSFTGQLDQRHFLSRMKEVLQEFSLRIGASIASLTQVPVKLVTDVLSITLLLTLRLLQMARTEPVQGSLTYELEVLLKGISSHLVGVLLSQGLEQVRKLYDDLQYLSFRERGIQTDQHAVQGWVVVIKVLEVARIPRGSFWDVANLKLIDVNVNDIKDARIMEKLWYSMYSLLPLCEFDEFGFVVTGQRHKVLFDNWTLPQQLLKKVFELCLSNPRQAPGFNDYCRSIVGRCHYLMVEWGWWTSSPIIGAIFDCFAARSLSHLRNEEVYASPRFLEELDKEPSLAIEPEDRCFHIFLKIVALGILHLREAENTKGIRNLVARLLPNHNRQYLKEEAINLSDIASLRNHHDLLSTIFFSAPPEYRPPVTLLAELVDIEKSHREACALTIKCCANLSVFLISKTHDEAEFERLVNWQQSISSKLYHQYNSAELEIRDHASSLQGKDLVSEQQVRAAIESHRYSTMCSISSSLCEISRVLNAAENCELLFTAYMTNIKPVLDCLKWTGLQNVVVMHGIVDIVNTFISQAEKLISHAPVHDQILKHQNLTITLGALFQPLHEFLTVAMLTVGRPLDDTPQGDTLWELLRCWARIIITVTDHSHMPFDRFLPGGDLDIFEGRKEIKDDHANFFWPIFLTELLRFRSVASFQTCDVAEEWMKLALHPQVALNPSTEVLARQLIEKGHLLFKDLGPEGWVGVSQQAILRWAIDKMSSTTGYSAYPLFQQFLRSMQCYLKQLTPGSPRHRSYEKFVQNVVSTIRSHAHDIPHAAFNFFIVKSEHFTPHPDDEKLWGAHIISYSSHLNTDTGKPMRLAFNIFREWCICSRGGNNDSDEPVIKFACQIRKSMYKTPLANFYLKNWVPALVTIVAKLAHGHFAHDAEVLLAVFLPIVYTYIHSELTKPIQPPGYALPGCTPEPNHAECVFNDTIELLKLLYNQMIRDHEQSSHRFNADSRGIIPIAILFAMNVLRSLYEFSLQNSALHQLFKNVQIPFQGTIESAHLSLVRGVVIQWQPRSAFHCISRPNVEKIADQIAAAIKDIPPSERRERLQAGWNKNPPLAEIIRLAKERENEHFLAYHLYSLNRYLEPRA